MDGIDGWAENRMSFNFCLDIFFVERAPAGALGAPGARPPLLVYTGAPGAQPPLRGALSFFPWKAPQCGVLEGFWTLSRQLSPGTRAPEALGLQGPSYTRVPEVLEGSWAARIWGQCFFFSP